jgi:drug/metabolite transporter (DMT)-like permease
MEWGLLAAVALIWGSSFVFMAIGLDAFRPGVVTLARVALGALTLAMIPKARVRIDSEDRLRVLGLGIIWIGIPLTIFPIAQQWIDSSVAGMLNGAVPITAAAWATLLLGRLPGWRQLVGIGIGFVGVVFGLIQIPGSTWAWPSALAMIPLGALGTGLAFVLMATLVGRVGGPRGSIAIYFVPVVAIVLGVVVRGDALQPVALVGTALVLAGAWIASRRDT